MADNVEANAGSGGATFSTDENVSRGAHVPHTKIQWGADGTFTDTTTAAPFPVEITDVDNTLVADIGSIKTAVEVIDNAVAIEGSALGSGVLLQGDDGTDRKNLNVDATTGDLQVDVTNTVTVDLGANNDVTLATLPDTASGDLAAIKTAVEVIDNAISGSEMQVDIVTSALPTGAATAALQSTGNTTLSAIQTAVELLDNTVSGSELQVDIVSDGADLLTNTTHNAAFGTAGTADTQVRTVQGIASMTPLLVDATGQGDIPITLDGEAVTISGSVTVTGDVTNAGAFAVQEDGAALTALQLIDNIVLTEDATHNTGDAGVQVLAVRNDELAALAGTDGDYTPLQVDGQGALYAAEYNRIDSNNSTTTPLAGDATFTGTATDCREARNISVLVFADQDSATDGLKIQFSGDGANWDDEEDYTITANAGETHTVPVMGQYYRVTYTNGSTIQTAFRLQSTLMPHDITGSVTQLRSTIGDTNQAVLTRSVLAADNGSAYTNINATAGGNLKVSISEASDGLDIGAGNAGTETVRVSVATDDVNLSAINTATAAIQTAVELIDNTVAGSELQCDIVGALPAGANTIGDVTVSGDALTSLQLIDNIVQTEDAAHGTGDAGVMSLAVRNDDLAALAGTDGDYAPLQVSQNGALLSCLSVNDDYKYAAIDAATSGNNTLVAAVASRKIRVLALFIVAAGDVLARLEDGAGGTALTGQMDLTTNSGFVLPYNPAGWFETSVNTLLNLELDGSVSVDGSLTYIEVP